MKWFKHFSKAHEDRAVERLIMEYGVKGYGLYFYCLEIIAGSVEVDNITFELEPDAELLAYRLKMDTLEVECIMHRCLELGLFELNDSGRMVCMKMGRFIDRSATSNPQMRKIIQATHEKIENHDQVVIESGQNPDGIRMESGQNQEHPDQIRLDKIRIDKNREKKSEESVAVAPQPTPRFQKPTLEEIKEYCEGRKNSVDPYRFFDFYESKGWLVGKVKMKDWRAAVRNWERNDFAGAKPSDAAPAIDYDAREKERIEARVKELVDSGRFTEAEARANPWHPKSGVVA